MPKTYLAQSAAVLNEADRFQRILDWQLFTIEQERMLYSDPTTWVPGVPIYHDPRWHNWQAQQDDLWEAENVLENVHDYFGQGPWGNHARPMIMEIEDIDAHDYLKYTCNAYCLDCEVGWWPGYTKPMTECFNCGKLQKNIYYVSPEEKARRAERQRQAIENSGGLRGFTTTYLIVDEIQMSSYTQMDVVVTAELWRAANIRPYTPPLRPTVVGTAFERRDVPDIPAGAAVFFNPSERTGPPYARLNFLPRNWRSMRADIPLPSRPEPRDYSDWQFGDSRGPALSQFDRRSL